MQVAIADPIGQTYIFMALLFAALIFSLGKRTAVGTFGIDVTQELKGFAILAIVFAHVGYFLAADHAFLFPLSILAGTGVDIFLLLSGFGLAASALSREMSPIQFYRRRLSKLYVPLWIVLAVLFACDFLFLHISYGWQYIASSFLGFFPQANIFTDVNSPLWYFSFIVFYYLLFPIFFSRKWPYLSAAAFFLSGWALVQWSPPVLRNVVELYQLHLIAFPLGVALAAFQYSRNVRIAVANDIVHYLTLAAIALAVAYLSLHAHVGEWYLWAELTSLAMALLVTVGFILKRFSIRLLSFFGLLSFEIYLIHWPLMYRYDVFFEVLPAAMALALSLALCVGVGWLLRRAALSSS